MFLQSLSGATHTMKGTQVGRTIIVGTGLLAHALVRALERQGRAAVMVGRRDGVDVREPIDLRPFADGDDVDAVVEATSIRTRKSSDAVRFFEASARHVGAAAQDVGAGMHVVVSIVGCGRASGYAHYDGKKAQENAARAVATEATPAFVVSSTQWFELARQMADRFAFGPVAAIPAMRVRPVALDAVADVVADLISGRREREDSCLCGPVEMTLSAMVAALAGRPALRVPVPMVGAGRAVRTGALLPTGGSEVVGGTFEDWLAAHPDGRRLDLVA